MIGRLRGILADKGADGALIDVGGVGYADTCPLTVLDRLPSAGSECTVSIHTHVREDQITLFGFNDGEQRRLFRMLIGVSGVGPKLALACLSGLDADGLVQAIGESDVKRLSSVPGIGKRTAERLILELREKVGFSLGLAPKRSRAIEDLESALRNLGYTVKEVDRLLTALGPDAHEMPFDALLREALRRLAK
jgi:Holliday junction DNA helicase RuvA